MKYVPVVLGILLLVAGCSKYGIYEENLQFMTAQTLAAEKAVTDRRLEEANRELAEAKASQDSKRIKMARSHLSDATEQSRAVAQEEHRRARRR